MIPAEDKNIGSRLMAAPFWFYLCLLLLLVVLSYSNSIYSPFVLDDFHSFVHNRSVYAKDISFDSLKQLSSSKFGKARIIPLATFAIDHHLGAGSIVQYHLTNIVIHLFCTLAVFFLVKGVLQTTVGKSSLKFFSINGFSLLAAAFWALNPVQTNAVTYVVQRMTSVATFFYVGSLAFYTYGRLSRSLQAKVFLFAGAFLAALFSFFSKENSFTLPIAILMVEFFFLSRKKVIQTVRSVSKTQWIILIIVLLLVLPLAEFKLHGILGGYKIRHFSLNERLFTELRVIIFYISLLLLPLPGRLNLEHDFMISESLFSPPATFFSLIFLFFLLIYALRTTKTYPLISFGILWFFLNLAIESTFVPLEIIFEHRLYLSSLGFFITILSLVDLTAAKTGRYFPAEEFKKVLFCALILLLCLSSILTTFRNNDWRDAITIHSDFVAKSPNKTRVYNDLGLSLSREGRNEEALIILEKGFELDKPDGEESLSIVNNIMVALSEMGRFEEGIDRGEQFIKESPPRLDVSFMGNFLYNLGVLYMRSDQYEYAFDAFIASFMADAEADYAIKAIVELLSKYYDDPDARQVLGMNGEEGDQNIAVYVRLAEIMYDFRQYDAALGYLSISRQKAVNTSKAKEIFSKIQEKRKEKIVRQKEFAINNHVPYKQNATYRTSLYLADFIEKHYTPLHFFAGWLIRKADQLEPDDPFVALYLSRWLMKENNVDATLDVLSNSIEKHPDFVPILDMYAQVLQRVKREKEMANVLSHILNIYHGHPKWKKYEKLIRVYGVD